ncbi:glycoside hydrolase family 3 N-terminal domain-containing protein [Streptomyces sp. NPDC005808]|uniref:glycoside hydrolase family 3 protein n=1 Tax=Streptomyces sp. NPDC005808 TaxID=3364734 RepID=UPI0036CF86CD
MTVEEKIGQMIQPDLVELTADDVRTYHLGSALNGAGRWPGGDRRAGAQSWADTVGAFWEAAQEGYRDRPFTIPFMWASDAVHGHNNVHGATVFPHNIGLGAAADPDLIRRIGAATAREIAATGMDWTFAPTVATPRDLRWGRCYEGYSEDPEIVHVYARAMVEGLQGDAEGLRTDSRVISCVKHWVGDGGTFGGEDRGIARCDEDLLRNIHAMGFFSGIEAGSQSVMVSYSGWESDDRIEKRAHGSRYLITDVLKGALGFDGIVVGDWDAHPYVEGCTQGDAGNVIKAGVDVLMISTREKWQEIYRTALERVNSGDIPMSRIDDAVARVLRVKMRAGLWDKPRPQDRSLAGRDEVLGAPEHRELARESVRKSLVLLKHENDVLPLARTVKVLVTGSAADAIGKQTGGFTVTWQGDDVDLGDFPGGATLAGAISSVVGADHCTVDPGLEHADPSEHDVVVVAMGEDAYAEMLGTVSPWHTIGYSDMKASYARDLDILRRLRSSGATVVTVLFSGRPLYVTEEINLSDAFVAAWLPGPDARGITDLLFLAADGGRTYDFQGRLSFSWPRGRRSTAANRVPRHIPDYKVPPGEQEPVGRHAPLFPYGYGLTLHGPGGAVPSPLPLDEDDDVPQAPLFTADVLPVGPGDAAYPFEVSAARNGPQPISSESRHETVFVATEPVSLPDGTTGLSLTFKGIRTFVYAQAGGGRPVDLRDLVARGGELSFDVRVVEPPTEKFHLTCHNDCPRQPALDISDRLHALPVGKWTRVAVPLAELERAGVDFAHVDVPFLMWTEGKARLDIGGIQLAVATGGREQA